MSNTPNPVYEKLMKCYESFRSQIDFQPEVALILGSGLGDFANDIRVTATLDYHDIEGFPVSTVPGHAGRFIFGYVGDVPVVCMQGRVHYYEGYPMTDVVLPTRLMKLMGAKALFLTNAAGGITSNFDMYIQQKNSIAATVDTGFRTVLTSGLNNFVDSPEILEEMYNYVNELSDRTSYLLGFHAEYTTGGPLLEAVAKLAEKYHSPVWTHNAETKSEIEGCKERWGITPTQLMERLGMFQYGGGGYHCIWMEDRDFEIFRDRKLTAVTNPSSNLKLASGICPLKRFYDNGINLAIGTDGPASNNCLDMFREMFLTTGLSKVREMDAAGIPADAILYMATAGGAHAMQLTDCDRLAAGKKADLVMIDLHQPNMQPENNLIKNLVYSGSKQNVKLTMVNGQILYENGEFRIGFDPEEIYARSNAIIRRISGSHADN